MEKGGKALDDEALTVAVEAIGGFPYMFQLLGYRAWNLASDRTQVTAADIRSAAAIAQRELEERVYEATYYELTAVSYTHLDVYKRQERCGRNAILL